MNEKYKNLQNGSDIRGIAVKTEQHDVNLTPEVASLIGSSFAQFLTANSLSKQLHVAVGMDSRISGNKIKEGLIQGLLDMGCNVSDCGMASTPAMFMSTVLDDFLVDGAVMITASHLPYYYNGLKFFTKEGGLEKQDIKDILDMAEKNEFKTVGETGKVLQRDLITSYSNTLVETIRNGVKRRSNFNKPLSGFKIVVDAGNGGGGFYATQVLQELGADVSDSQFLEPDGMFPNHIPNPENKEAMQSISEAVLRHQADLGIIFDTDVDRAAIVDQFGSEINKNALIALISSIIIEEHPGTTIVTDSITSTGLTKYITSLGGIHHRFRRGYKNVINESIRLNNENIDSQLAIETSGHAALKENYFLDDGAFLVSKILIKAAKLHEQGATISDLLESFERPAEEVDFRLKMDTKEFREYGIRIITGLEDYVNKTAGINLVPKNFEGIRVNVDQSHGAGWFLVRLSLHEPLLVINIESDINGGVNQIIEILEKFLSRFELLEGLKK